MLANYGVLVEDVSGSSSRRWSAYRIARLPRQLRATIKVLPTVVRVKRLLRSTPDMRAVMAELDVEPRSRRGGRGETRELLSGVRGALALLGPRRDACVPRSLALFTLLTERGYESSFVSGVRREHTELVGHAWVTIGEEVLMASGDGHAAALFSENFRYDNQASSAVRRTENGL